MHITKTEENVLKSMSTVFTLGLYVGLTKVNELKYANAIGRNHVTWYVAKSSINQFFALVCAQISDIIFNGKIKRQIYKKNSRYRSVISLKRRKTETLTVKSYTSDANDCSFMHKMLNGRPTVASQIVIHVTSKDILHITGLQ